MYARQSLKIWMTWLRLHVSSSFLFTSTLTRVWFVCENSKSFQTSYLSVTFNYNSKIWELRNSRYSPKKKYVIWFSSLIFRALWSGHPKKLKALTGERTLQEPRSFPNRLLRIVWIQSGTSSWHRDLMMDEKKIPVAIPIADKVNSIPHNLTNKNIPLKNQFSHF